MPGMSDAVVIGSGPNGLVGANLLADAGWSVTVLEAGAEPGGAVRSGQITAPGFTSDLFSSFYPLAAVSPAIAALDLERWGLRWRRAPIVVAHPTADGPAALLSTDIDVTAASLDQFADGDGDAWRELHAEWARARDPLLQALLGGPFPPVRAGLRFAARLGPVGLLEFGRLALMPLRRLAEERFTGVGGGLLLAGHLMHLDGSVDGAGAVIPTFMLAMVGQDVGFPVPEGGAQALTDTLLHRLRSRGGRIVCDARAEAVEVRGGRAVAVRCADGRVVDAGRAVLADVSAPALYGELVDPAHLPARVRRDIARFQWDDPSFKVDWALSQPIPWRDPEVARAGTVHLGLSLDEISRTSWQLANRRVPDQPFLLLGQMTTTDPTRSPAGTESAWAYSHVPRDPVTDDGGDGITGRWDERETAAYAARMEARIEALAPGFRDTIIARHVFTPASLQAENANLVGGAVGGGTAQLHQQLVFRPIPGLGRPETPVKGLYLASAGAHPGGGVHGACGANAAKAAMLHDRLSRARR
ncbi:MAG: NAD(P)/FAD-dependent oxidoreductase [Acidimicrobiales bacterium]|nr:NAD(P)/FAD-dependent oxidoreductase [Acidimicrobiales bacterium]